jgi:hypothetical protein
MSGSPRGPPSSRSWYPPRQWAQGGPYDSDGRGFGRSLVVFSGQDGSSLVVSAFVSHRCRRGLPAT